MLFIVLNGYDLWERLGVYVCRSVLKEIAVANGRRMPGHIEEIQNLDRMKTKDITFSLSSATLDHVKPLLLPLWGDHFSFLEQLREQVLLLGGTKVITTTINPKRCSHIKGRVWTFGRGFFFSWLLCTKAP